MQFVFIGVLWGGERGKVKFFIYLLTIWGQESMKGLDVGGPVFSPSGQAVFLATCVFLIKCLEIQICIILKSVLMVNLELQTLFLCA